MTGFPKVVKDALASDQLIDIVTLGAKSGQKRTTEIWYTRVDDRIVICGTPGAGGEGSSSVHRRDWLANLKAHPDFWFCLKESLQFCIAAMAREINDPDDRRYVMTHPATAWYQDRVASIDDLVKGSPIVEVTFRPCV